MLIQTESQSALRREPQQPIDPLEHHFVPVPPVGPRGLSRRAWLRATRYMDEHLGEPLSLESIASAACVSRSHFARMFKLSSGLSVMDYLARLRIARAMRMLVEGGHSIAEISMLLGFCDQSHFSRVFRRVTGMTPARFAQSQGGAARERA